MYMHTGVIGTLYKGSICMYLRVDACICTVHDRITVNTEGKLPETVLQWTKIVVM